jgi:F-type H+-transporting ATPase subunit gamma
MKMVSAAKLRRAQDAIQNQRPYAKRMSDMIRMVATQVGDDFQSPLFAREKPQSEKKVLVFVLTSDRGLCGGFNSSVIKTAQRWIRENGASYASVQMGFVGKKGFEFFRNRKATIAANYTELGGKVTFDKARKLADHLVDLYISGQVDEIKIVYNEFKNAASQRPALEPFLPLQTQSAKEQTTTEPLNHLFRPSPAELLESLIEKNFGIQAFRYMLESQAGEHGARMAAMENATKNAGEMIRKLTLQYNKQRQSGITKELLEIISGSESLKG